LASTFSARAGGLRLRRSNSGLTFAKRYVTLTLKVLAVLAQAEKSPRPPIDDLFTDVYDTPPPNLIEQRQELYDHLAKYPHDYPMDLHKK
jgi:hypothetical protein